MIIANGKPMLILGGELGNSSASSINDINDIFPRLAEINLNTVLVPVSWELLEPTENSFDYTLTDKIIDSARENSLKVVFLWFGAWKNSMSCYAPEWFKKDYNRFPRARTSEGKPLEIASPFSDEVLNADLSAFTNWMSHLNNYDKDDTVIMIQVENEIGMLENARDFSSLAQHEYDKGVPVELMNYISENKNNLHPSLLKKWEDNGKKFSGSWKEVFGDDIFTDEYFMAWNYARYIENFAKKSKEISSRPLYLNAALNSRGRKPGEYPSAGPLAHLKDIWVAGAPSIDFLSPDIYDSGFKDWVNQYHFNGNTLFIPEVKRDLNNGAQAYYVLGHHNALGISPFSIENGDVNFKNKLASSYSILNELMPLLIKRDSYPEVDGVLFDEESNDYVLTADSTKITFSHFFTLPWDPRATDGSKWPETGGIIIQLSPEEYILAGTGIVAKFEDVSENNSSAKLGEDGFLLSDSHRDTDIEKSNNSNVRRIGLASVEEIHINPDGSISRIRTLNGDETHQGRHVRIGVDDNKILHIKTYRYK